MANEELYAELAGAILDGEPVDWVRVEASAGPDSARLIARLRVLAAVVELHRPSEGEGREAPTGRAAPPAARAPPQPELSGATDSGSGTGAIELDSELRPGERWGHLVVSERIGRGASGSVYRAWDERLDREVALKLRPVPASLGARRTGSALIEEGRALARVRHPNVVTLFGAEEIGGRIGLWMELVVGRTLEQRVDAGGPLAADDVVRIGIELCGAVAAVHAASLLHGDIKASNVMLADDGRLVLMDFGTGRLLSGARTPLAGTPLYLAPELFAGDQPTVASDIYSVGVVLFRLLTGRYPIEAVDLDGLRAAHARGQRAEVTSVGPELPPRLAAVVHRALESDPERRHPTAVVFGTDLASLLARGRRARRRRWAVTAGIAAAASAAGLAWVLRDSPLTQAASRAARSVRSERTDSGGQPAVAATGIDELRSASHVLVVLPFENLNDEPGSDDFAYALTDEVLRDLARVKGLTVRSRHSSFLFRGPPRDLRVIGERLRAPLAVTGSVLRAGGRLRVHAGLVDTASGESLWSGRFDRELTSSGDLLAVTDEIARWIVDRLRLTLGAGRRRYGLDLASYDRYREARALVAQRGREGPLRAIALLEEILTQTPGFAPALAALAEGYAFLSILTHHSPVDPAEALARMRLSALRAVELDPLLAEAHAALGAVHAREWSWRLADQSFARAIELDPTLSASYTAYSFSVLRPLGRFAEAERLLLHALENDPLSLDIERELAQLQMITGRYDEAIARLERIRRVEPELPFVNQFLARALTFSGRPAEGLALLEQETAKGRPSHHYAAHALTRLGRRAEAERLAVEHGGYPQRAAVVYAALGDLDRSFAALERMASHEPQRLAILLTYPELEPLRTDPRLDALRRRVGLP